MSVNRRRCVITALQAERVVAAYLGFDNVIDLQRFVIMWPCLEAVRLLYTLPGMTSINLEFPRTTEAHQATENSPRVGRSTDHVQPFWVVYVLIFMEHSVGVYETNAFEQNRARTAVAINNMSSYLWIPDHIVEEDDLPPSPILRPTVRFGESPIIPLHRCLCLLRYLEISHGSVTRREQYLDDRARYSIDEFEVTEHDVPWWMRHYL
ncbi:hypothetical protein PITC_038670 [Penicillium italicum]|uniref:Uncharacterized protein n=1 Tax=Penicillium italicum TaxID=40296 RepID=A0A0A2KGN9_PENIT|nr:hypothetical protein PITC_038670 [Penicillium italicum]